LVPPKNIIGFSFGAKTPYQINNYIHNMSDDTAFRVNVLDAETQKFDPFWLVLLFLKA
jgi:dipeptide/tripeptide permease